MDVPFRLDRRAHLPLYRQIYDGWRTGILTGLFPPGERIPSSRAFASACGIARITVTAAYEQLLAEGYFESRHGSGTYVSTELPDEALRPMRVHAPRSKRMSSFALSHYGARLGRVRTLPQSAKPLNLSKAGPDLTLFPFDRWRRLVSRHLRGASPAVFDHRSDAAGHRALQRAIADRLARTRAVRCDPAQVIIVSGSQQALDLCARLLVNPGDEVAMEDPGYSGARQLFQAHGASLNYLPVTEAGASLDGLTTRTKLVHVTPSHQVPIGVSMSVARRLALLDWARAQRAIVIEDDYDSEYRYDGPPLPAMHGLGSGASVIYVGTFSTVMMRGLRIGYAVVPPELIESFVTAKFVTDRHTTLLEQAALADFIGDGELDRHVRRMRRVYKRRRDVLLEGLARHFGPDAVVRGEAAGLHVTVRFREGRVIRDRAERAGVHLSDTSAYYVAKPPPNEFMLAFAAVTERTIREALKQIGRA